MNADCVEGIDAQRLSGYRIHKDGKTTQLSYPLDCFPLNVTGKSLHNGRFIQKMRQKAASLPKYTMFFVPWFKIPRSPALTICLFIG